MNSVFPNISILTQLMKKIPAFTEPKGSLPCLQDLAICPCPWPVQYGPHIRIMFL